MNRIQIIIFVFCIIDVAMGIWCLYLTLESEKLKKWENKGDNKNGKQYRFMGKNKQK